MIKTKELEFSYGQNVKFNFPDLNVADDECLLVLGDSGTGKTTLLHILAGLLPPLKGEIIIDGQSLYKLKGGNLDKFRGDNISVIFQKPHFISSITAIENLNYANVFSGTESGNEAKAYLDQLNIGHLAASFTHQMSQGEQQRLSIARALVNSPKLILADEPTSALDDKNCDAVYELLIKEAKAASASLIIVTHDQRLKDKIENRVVIE